MPSGVREAFERAIEEHRAAQEIHADRPESHLQLGVLAFENGDAEKAEQHYRQAIRIDARFVPAYVNLADLYRVRNRDDRGEEVLLRGTSLIPESAELHSALGLLLVRRSRLPEAIAALGRALELRPDDHEAAFAYGIALHAAGNTKEALEVLSRAHDRSPGSPELLLALATISRDRGYLPAAVDYARKLSRLTPGDPVARRLVEELEGKLGPR
jgi:Flp pilus assembly protein TadD